MTGSLSRFRGRGTGISWSISFSNLTQRCGDEKRLGLGWRFCRDVSLFSIDRTTGLTIGLVCVRGVILE